MAVSNAQKIAKAKYQQSNRTLIAADVSKTKGEFYRQSAKDLDLSLSMLIQSGIEEYIANHGGEVIQSKPESEKLTAEQEHLIEVISKLPYKAQKQLIKFLELVDVKGEI